MKTIGYDEASTIFSTPNKIYKVYNNIELSGNTLNIPSGCTLDIQGGMFSNGTIVGHDTVVIKESNAEAFSAVTRTGTWQSGDDADVPYVEGSYNGMGRVVLKKHYDSQNPGYDKQPTLYQSDFPSENTVYVVRYDFVLGEDITIPANCVLEFEGGSISGEHTITGNNTEIRAGLVKIFDTDVTIDGYFSNSSWIIEWFGTNGDGINDDSIIINSTISKLHHLSRQIVLYFCKTKYRINDTITLDTRFISYEINADILCDNIQNSVAIIATSSMGSGDGLHGNMTNYIKGIKLKGGTVMNSSIGIKINGPEFCLYNCEVWLFNTGIYFDDNSYIISLFKCCVVQCEIGIYSPDGTNKGENISFFGGCIGNCDRAVVCVLGNIMFNGVSIDHSNQLIYGGYSSILSFIGCHFESYNQNQDATKYIPVFLDNNGASCISFESCDFLMNTLYNYELCGRDYFMYVVKNLLGTGGITLNNCRTFNIATKYLCKSQGAEDVISVYNHRQLNGQVASTPTLISPGSSITALKTLSPLINFNSGEGTVTYDSTNNEIIIEKTSNGGACHIGIGIPVPFGTKCVGYNISYNSEINGYFVIGAGTSYDITDGSKFTDFHEIKQAKWIEVGQNTYLEKSDAHHNIYNNAIAMDMNLDNRGPGIIKITAFELDIWT